MQGFRAGCILLLAAGAMAACSDAPVSQPRVMPDDPALGVLNATDHHGARHITVLDDCDPNDPNWNNTGGCVLRGGAVTEHEFGVHLASPLSLSVVGHPAWRNEPSYLRVEAGKDVRVTNRGGRLHSFTEVANFGGGFVPPLNIGLTPSPECVPPPNTPGLLPPGGTMSLTGLATGDHRYICCIHPWMRALITVE